MRRFSIAFLLLLLVGCAGLSRECSSCWAGSVGADWVVVQMTLDGHAFRCWELPSTSISNEDGSDGIYWKSPTGHLVHISGMYNRVQVEGGNWESAYQELGLSREACKLIGERMDMIVVEKQ